jgi:hypothetical protein
MKSAIINFFAYMSAFTGHKINGTESIPMLYWGETYVTGFKVDESNNVMVHFKIVKQVNLGLLEGTRSDYYMMNPDGDFWLPYEMLDETTIDDVFDEYQQKIMALNEFDILHMEYRKKNTEELMTEGVIFASKRLACKETIRYRREIPQLMYKILHFGEPKKKKDKETFSAFEFATSALE